MKIIRFILLAVTFCFSIGSCADANLEQELGQYCETFNPDNWKGLEKDAELQDIYAHIVKAQNLKIKNADLKAVIDKSQSGEFNQFYHRTRQNIESLLGGEWKCEVFDAFFLPEQRVISLSLNAVSKKRIDPNGANNIIVILSHSGEVLINNAALLSSTPDNLRLGLVSRIANRPYDELNFVLYADEGADGGRLASMLGVFAELGIKNVDLIDF